MAMSQALRSPRWSVRVLPDHLRETSAPAACVAEVLAAVRLALARSPQAFPGVFGWIP